MRNLLEEAQLAEQVGLDVFGVGEHHRPDFAVSAPALAPEFLRSRRGALVVGSPEEVVEKVLSSTSCSGTPGHLAQISVGDRGRT